MKLKQLIGRATRTNICLWLLILVIGVLFLCAVNRVQDSRSDSRYKRVTLSVKRSTYQEYPTNFTFLQRKETRDKLIHSLMQVHPKIGLKRMQSMIKTMTPSVWHAKNSITLHTPSGRRLNIDMVHRAIHDTDNIVPSVIHFILPLEDKPQLQFYHAVGIISAYWIDRPKKLMLWYNKIPTGHWWNYLKQNITNWNDDVIMIHRTPPDTIYNYKLGFIAHKADIIRLEALAIFGGVYFDTDMLTLKSLQPLKKFPFTIGREVPYGLSNGAMIATPNSTFPLLMYLSYQVSFNLAAIYEVLYL